MSARWAAWLGLLFLEVGALSARYHWAALPEERLGYARWLVEPAFPAALVTVLAVASIRRRRHEGDDSPGGSHLRWLFFIGQPVVFLGFLRSVAWIVSEDLASSPYPDARLIDRFFGDPLASPFSAYWIGGSALLGVAALVLWVAAVFPVPVRTPWRWVGWGPSLMGIGFGIASVAAGWMTQSTWPDLGRATLWLVHLLLTTISGEVVYRPSEAVVGIRDFSVWIAPACSGYEGIGLVLVYLGLYLWFDRRKLLFPRAFLLFPLGVAAIWLANAIRLTALVAVGAYVSPAVAARGFHIQAGWLAFNAVALSLVVLARRTQFLRRESAIGATGEPSLTAAYLTPMLAVVATAMITGLFSDGFDRLYPLRVLAAAAILIYFRRAYSGLRWTVSWRAVAAGVLVFGLWLALGDSDSGVSVGGGTKARWEALSPALKWTWMFGRVVGSVALAPLVEELAFRGYLIRRLIARDFAAVSPTRLTWTSLLISSLLFGALHQRWLAGAAAGVIYALAQRRRGELADSVVAHATTNALLATQALATGDWSSWS